MLGLRRSSSGVGCELGDGRDESVGTADTGVERGIGMLVGGLGVG